ncbi:MYB DNA-binding domain protein [Pyrenophora tritici-repentis]|nr:MYB DNA-binding domain protein [Pyrenophora tritici-repentis]KAI0621818.1 MYB DNA-binding domain protein [Pyrenophora tritici-repentis]
MLASVELLFCRCDTFPLAWYLAASTDVVAQHSSSPSAKRSLKPSPISATVQPSQQYSAPPELPSLQPAASFTAANPDSHTGTQQPQPSPTSRKRKSEPKTKKSRTNTPWTPAEELRLKQMRDAGNSWSEIAKTFPQRTEGSVKKHWYKDMHYAEFAEDESAALLAAIKEYDANKWKVIGQKVGKPAKACEQYAKENFAGRY